jgi:hypothetical protein
MKLSIQFLTCDVFTVAWMEREIFKKFTASRDVVEGSAINSRKEWLQISN